MDRDNMLITIGVVLGMAVTFFIMVFILGSLDDKVENLEKAIKEAQPKVYEYHYYEQPTKRGLK